MKYILIRTQVIFLSVILLLTFGLLMALGVRYNARWDLTPEKIYSLAEGTTQALKQMTDSVEVIAFYPHDDPARSNFEVFLKQCQLLQPHFRYSFYDPHRSPNLAKEHKVQDLYTVILRYQKRVEKIVQPTEQTFTNSLIKLLYPKVIPLCFSTGHKEASLQDKERNGYAMLREMLVENGYDPREIILSRDKVPEACRVLVLAGPHQEFDRAELDIIDKTFREGRGVLFLIDPMAAGEGLSFVHFMKTFGITIGQDVIVDKASRMAGGDFLVALVSQYVSQHPITSEFQDPSFFPVSRSVQPSVDVIAGIETVPLALSSPESWSETNLEELSQGQAKFDSSFDVTGPIAIAAAAEGNTAQGLGRMVVIGDSDFLTNGFINFPGNLNFALNAIQWLSKDERLIMLRPREESFKPLFIKPGMQFLILVTVVGLIPGFFLVLGLVTLFGRKRKG